MQAPNPAILRRTACLLGIMASILFLLAMYSGYALDFPYADQWDFIPVLEKTLDGELTPADLWAQHNEHRLVFPRLLMLALALPSHWDIHWELAANFALALLTWLALCWQVRAGGVELRGGDHAPIYMAFSLLLFSLSQWGNWFLGWQLQEFMNVFSVVLALILLNGRRWPGLGMAAAACCAFVATYSFANGMLIWPIGILVIFLQRRDRGPAFRAHIAVWSAVGLATAVSYLYGYETPTYHGPLSAALERPAQCVSYILAYLGQPVGRIEDLVSIAFEIAGHGSASGDHTFTMLVGILGLLLWGLSLIQCLVAGVPARALHPWVGFALYAVATACITALGRAGEGVEQAMSSRYVTMANLLWLPVIVQVYWAARAGESTFMRRVMPLKIAVLCVAVAGASLAGAYRWSERYSSYGGLREDLLHGNDASRLAPLYPPAPETIIERRAVLRDRNLGIFHAGDARPGAPVAREDR